MTETPAEPREDGGQWVGYCAPGRKPIAWMHVIALSGTVVDIQETKGLEGSTDVILVNLDAMPGYLRDLIRQTAPAVTALLGEQPAEPDTEEARVFNDAVRRWSERDQRP